ncbi:hypothetical protein BKA62DRAFT_829885 [Auriculariales sp. MPI-PUGE-AT-0066]|nr:hypothetical protein BKA62DRAFT_829885 [Auriculariales sp. MPI-PUGE-AT-0066]
MTMPGPSPSSSSTTWPPVGSYKCYFCGTHVASNREDMLAHWNQENPCICPVSGCGLQLACWGLYSLHMRNVHHVGGRPESGDTFCNVCNNYFSSATLYTMHRGAAVCPVRGCPYQAQCSTAVYQHQAAVHLPRGG